MPLDEGDSRSSFPDEVWARALAEFRAWLDRSGDQRNAILERLKLQDAPVAQAIERLIERHSAEERSSDTLTLEFPAIDLIESPYSETVPKSASAGARSFWRSIRPKSTFSRFFFVATIVCLFLYAWVAALMFRFGSERLNSGWDATWNGGPFVVTSVENKGPAAGKLRPGDRITAIDGDPYLLFPSLFRLPIDNALGYRVRVDRNGHVFDVYLQESKVRRSRQVTDVVTFFMVSGFYFLMAVSIALLKADNKVAQLASLALLAEAIVLLSTCAVPYGDLIRSHERWLLELLDLPSGIHFAVAYHFYSAFFAGLRHSVQRKYVLWLLYPWSLLTAASLEFAGGLFHFPFILHRPQLLAKLFVATDAFFVAGPLFICLLITIQYVRVRKEPGHLRARWIAFGSLGGILPYMLVRLARIAAASTDIHVSFDLLNTLFLLSIIASAAIPSCAAYAVLRYQVFEIQLQIRRGLQYVLLYRGWWALPAVPILCMLLLLRNNWTQTVGQAVGQNAVFICLGLVLCLLLTFRGRVQHWLDKRYERDASQRVERLRALLTNLGRAASVEQLTSLAIAQIPSIGYGLIALAGFEDPEDHSFSIRGANLYAAAPLQLSAQSPLIAALERAGTLQYLDQIRLTTAANSDIDCLARLGVDLAAPILSSKRKACGILLLGSSREGYTRDQLADIRLAAGELASVYQRLQSQASSNRSQSQPDVAVLLECFTCGLCFGHPATHCTVDDTPLKATFRINRLLLGRYELVRRLGKGGMGTVFESYDIRLRRKVAVKILACPSGQDSAIWRARAEREAQALAQLNHQNIVIDYDSGALEDGTAYIVMEFVVGVTLRQVLARGCIARARAALWLDQMLHALAAAHAAGIVHRDLKPENILISTPDPGNTVPGPSSTYGPLKIVDFGIAKLMRGDGEAPLLTLAGFGTPMYMSPEQLDGDPVDERSDLFTVGLIAIELLLGQLPFKSVAERKRFFARLPLEGALPVATESELMLNNALQKCLQTNPEHRHRSAEELRKEIVHLIRAYGERSPELDGSDFAAASA